MNARIGFRWSADPRFITTDKVRRLLPRFAATGAAWVIFPIPLTPLPEAQVIAEATGAAGLEPVVQLLARGAEMTPDTVRSAAAGWIAGGVTRVVVDDQPNRAERWSRWVAQGLPQQYARWLAPLLETLAEDERVIPIFPPLAARGDYRGLTFLREALSELRRLHPAWLNRLAVACANDQQGHSVGWGQGGPALWGEESRAGHEDDGGLFGWEWAQQVASTTLGRTVEVYAVQSRLTATDSSESQAASVALLSRFAATASVPLVATFPALDEGGWFQENGTVASPHLLESLRTVEATKESDNQSVPRSIRVLHGDGRVETMALDDYLRGVVPAEIGAGSPVEALKAQAIAARCYAARTVRSPRHRTADADICTTTHCQVWRAQTYPRTDEAVAATAGIVAYADGRIIDAVYFACCDGNTKNSEDVWRSALSYLRSVPCTLKHQEQYGHGVGMCQRGAIQMAKQGASYADILRHYYTGVSVEKGIPADGIPAPTPTPVPPPSVPPTPPPSIGIRIERRAGVRAVAGNLRRHGVTVTVADPWGNQYRTLSGNKPDMGTNGWEIIVPVDAVYRVTWADNSISVPVRGDFVVIYENGS
jgi:hypothetical protein